MLERTSGVAQAAGEGVAAVERAVRLAPSDVAYARTLTALKAELKR